MKTIIFRGDLPDISAMKEALVMQATLHMQETATTKSVNIFYCGIPPQGTLATDEQRFKSSCSMQAKLIVTLLHEIQRPAVKPTNPSSGAEKFPIQT